MQAQVQVGPGVLSNPHPVKAGVRQGGVSSATLYTLFLDSINDDLRSAGLGTATATAWCGNSMYADDMALMADTVEELQTMLHVAAEHSY